MVNAYESKRMKRNDTYLPVLLLWLLCLAAIPASAQDCRSDSAEAQLLRSEGVSITEGNRVKLLPSGHAKFEDMFAELEKAECYINMEYFNFRNDSINNLLIALLARKVREGVDVRVLYDAFGNASNNSPISGEKHDSIRALGIDIVQFDPLKFPWLTHIMPRDHRKIVVIDGRVAYTGGMNVADYYIDGIEGIGPWRDMHLHLEGPVVDELNGIFRAMWWKATGESLLTQRYLAAPRAAQDGGSKLAVVDRTPRTSNRAIRQLYVSMLDGARYSVRIINPYFVPTHAVRSALKRAIDRGVKVEIMLSAKSDIALTPDASHYVGNNMAKRGATVYLFEGGFHHTKMMIVDSLYCTVGSANLDSRSLRCDYEVNTVIFDREVVRQLNEMFDTDITRSVRMERGYWRTRPGWHRFLGWFGNLLTPVL